MSKYTDNQKLYSQIVVKAWSDEDFKKKLIADPVSTLRQEGFSIPDGMELSVEEGATKWKFPLPAKPDIALGGAGEDPVLGYSSSTCCCSH